MTDWISAFVRVRYRLSLQDLEISMTPDLANEPAIRFNHVRQTDREAVFSSSAYHRIIIRIIIGDSPLHGRLKFKKSLPLEISVIGFQLFSYACCRFLKRAAWSLNNYARSIGRPLTALRANRIPPSTRRIRIRRANLIKHLC